MESQNVILLRKNLASKFTDECSWIPEKNSHWMVLGHFDEMYIYTLNQDSDFLSCIQKSKSSIAAHNNAAVHYHPIYTMPHFCKIREDNDKRLFIAIIRIHLALTQQLTNQFDKLCESIQHDIDENILTYQIYHATEFSDMVLDIRADNLEILLKTVLTLRQYKQIGKMYTYFGINVDFLKSHTEIPMCNDDIPMLSMRFSGSDIPVIKEQIKIIKNILGKEPEYSVNGVDDILLLYTNLPTARILTLYREWFFNAKNINLRQSESTTRVGIEIDIENQFAVPSKTDLAPLCQKLLPLRDEVAENIAAHRKENECRWFPTISEVANSLVRMSNTAVMDEVVYLLAPGVETFLSNVLHQLKTHDPQLVSSSTIYYTYVENCAYLMEQLMRIEGQLSQRPEMRPVICDIPVFMLEYTLAFLNKVSDLLQEADVRPRLHYVFLLVPRPCEHIAATELFRATSNRAGLVQLEIPEKTLYSPTTILRALCHEISHYVGEKYRNRTLRREFYSRAAAVLLTECIFRNKSQKISYMLESLFMDRLLPYNEPTIQEMHQIIEGVAEDIFFSSNALNVFYQRYFEKIKKPVSVEFPSKDAIIRGAHRFSYRCLDLDTLFREVYADICMLHILNLQTDDYIESILQELANHPDVESITYDAFAIRIYICLTALNRAKKYERNSHRDIWTKIRTIISNIQSEIENETDGETKLHYPIGSVYSLLQYAEICCRTICTLLPFSHTMEVRDMYSKLLAPTLEYSTILGEIENCRMLMVDFAKKNQ